MAVKPGDKYTIIRATRELLNVVKSWLETKASA